MARVAVVGVGAIGGALAGLLQVAGKHEITLCTRRPLTRLMVSTPEGEVTVEARNVTNPAEVGVVDWVLVSTKAYDAAATSKWFSALTGGKSPVAVLQNGVEHRERFAPYLSADRILPVIIDCSVERKSEGQVLQRSGASMKVENGDLGREFAGLFAGSKAEVKLTEDFVTEAWLKLCVNSAGALSALVGKPAGIFQDEELGRSAIEIVSECVAVGKAEGAQLDNDMPQKVLSRYRSQPADSVNSMLADRLAGRQMEIDARNGVIVRKGSKHGIPTPANQLVVALLQAFEGKA